MIRDSLGGPPQPVIVIIMAKSAHIRALLYSYSTTITERGVHLRHSAGIYVLARNSVPFRLGPGGLNFGEMAVEASSCRPYLQLMLYCSGRTVQELQKCFWVCVSI